MAHVDVARNTVEEIVPQEVLQRIMEELRRHGVRARVRLNHRGTPDIYIDYDDLDKLFQLCDRGVLSKEARELLC
ncbi:hypothetical protein PYJP_07290 [Pyrofollis japonicus]|uniref:hypothetical protein n=1 Tax=Pyrofollis japonicus TaxID=3060460 RepID=UPI00295B98A7|nr:hypothetical protein [Pyrofollis japonicus]BEP17377.1 hypothetical protein PYJP_07290 [Pyrofollis japonicus]